jgi:hypothetical protein
MLCKVSGQQLRLGSDAYAPDFVARSLYRRHSMSSDLAQQRAEKSFKKEERARDGRKAMSEYEAQTQAIREKTERLKALRLAKEAVIAL